MEERILNHVVGAIKELAKIYADAMNGSDCTFFRDEESVQFYLYGLLFKMEALVAFNRYGRKDEKNILLHAETDTKDAKGRFDFAVYSPENIVNDEIFVAIELKTWVDLRTSKVITNILKDLRKLANESIPYPIFVLVDKTTTDKRLLQFIKDNKSAETTFYHITPKGMTVIQ